MSDKCNHCKYHKYIYNEYTSSTGWCNSPKNAYYKLDMSTGKKIKRLHQSLENIDKNTCEYKPTFSKKLSNILRFFRLKYYKFKEPELFLT